MIVAVDRGSPALSGSVTLHLPLLDVNDNGPELEAPYRPLLWENSPAPHAVQLNRTSALLHVVDRDSPEHGPPFSLALSPQHSQGSLYAVSFQCSYRHLHSDGILLDGAIMRVPTVFSCIETAIGKS